MVELHSLLPAIDVGCGERCVLRLDRRCGGRRGVRSRRGRGGAVDGGVGGGCLAAIATAAGGETGARRRERERESDERATEDANGCGHEWAIRPGCIVRDARSVARPARCTAHAATGWVSCPGRPDAVPAPAAAPHATGGDTARHGTARHGTARHHLSARRRAGRRPSSAGRRSRASRARRVGRGAAPRPSRAGRRPAASARRSAASAARSPRR